MATCSFTSTRPTGGVLHSATRMDKRVQGGVLHSAAKGSSLVQQRVAFRHTAARSGMSLNAIAEDTMTTVSGAAEFRIDSEAPFDNSFAIPPEELVVLAKKYLDSRLGVDNNDLMAEDFAASLPVVGPLSKEAFLQIFGGFNISENLEDFCENYFGFTVDPLQPNRVWVMSRAKGKHVKPLFGVEPTNKVIEVVPTISSMQFNEAGQVVKFTTGYPMDKDEGNTGGMSAAFGIVHAIKPGILPFPEGRPYKRSLQFKIFSFLGGFAQTIRQKS